MPSSDISDTDIRLKGRMSDGVISDTTSVSPLRETDVGKSVRKLTHGKIGTYVNRHCKCDECRAVWAAYYRAYRERRRNAKKLAEVMEERTHSEVNSRLARL
jgi:hypothetical protein